MNITKIGELLKSLREGKGMTQAQLAERFNVSTRTVSRWETGSNMPDVELLIELADFYEVDIREIIDGERKSENMDTETGDTMKKVAAYAVRNTYLYRNRVVARYAGFGTIIAIMINMLFNKESVGALIGIVPEQICDVIIQLFTAGAIVGAFTLALYWLGAFDEFARWKKNRQ